MEFFNQLLTSYNLLKKRQLHVVMDEAKAVKGYSDVYKICNSNSEQSEVACDAANRAYDDANEIVLSAKQTTYTRQAEGKKKGEEIPIANLNKTTNKLEPIRGKIPTVRSDLAVLYFTQGLNNEVNNDGEELSPEVQELIQTNPNAQALLELNDKENDGTIGSQLVGALGELFRVANKIGLGSLFKDKSTSIVNKVFESLLGTNFVGATEKGAKAGTSIVYNRPDPQVVIGALDNLRSILELGIKAGGTEKLTQNDYQHLKNSLTIVEGFSEGGYERFRVFVKSKNEIDENTLGLSFDWYQRNAPTELQDFITVLEENLERLNKDENSDIEFEEGEALDRVDRTSVGGSARDLGSVIGEVSEDMPVIVSLLIQSAQLQQAQQLTASNRARGEAMRLFNNLVKRHSKYSKKGEYLGNNIERAFDLDENAESGYLIGTDETTALNVGLKELKDAYEEKDFYKLFQKLVPKLLTAVAREVNSLEPKFVARVGTSRGAAGDRGDKTDIVYFYDNTEEGQKLAAEGAKKAGTTVKMKPLREVVTGEDLTNLLRQRGIDATPDTEEEKRILEEELNKEYPYIESSLKCTRNPARTNAGSTKSPRDIASEFIGGRGVSDKDKQYANDLIDVLHKGVKREDRASVRDIRANFKQIQDDSKALDQIFEGVGSTSVSEEEARNTFIKALDETSLGSLGLSTEEQDEIIKKISGADGAPARQTLRKKLESGILARRIENNKEDRSWRSVGALLMMRGCYDTHDGSKQVLDYLKGVSYRYNGNKSLMKTLRSYVDSPTGEGWKSSTGSIGTGEMFGVGGYSANYTQSKETGTLGLDFEAPVDRSKPIMGDPSNPGAENSSTEYSPTELMNKLLEVQQLIFSSLIKE